VYAREGRYRDAIREYLHYVNVTQSDAARAVGYGSIAQLCWRKHDPQQGAEAAREEIRYQKGAVWNSLLFALDRGDSASAASFRDQLFRDMPYPVRGVRHEQRSYDYFRGTLALREGKKTDAIQFFEEALRHLPPSSGLDSYDDCLGNAYLSLDDANDAIAEYQRILRMNPDYPLAQYHLAKAWELKHQPDQALASYRRFLEVWSHADADIPEVADARSKIAAR